MRAPYISFSATSSYIGVLLVPKSSVEFQPPVILRFFWRDVHCDESVRIAGTPLMVYGDLDSIPEFESLEEYVPNVEAVSLERGHWIQQELPKKTHGVHHRRRQYRRNEQGAS